MSKHIVALSGGMDSTTAAGYVWKKGAIEILCVTVQYGSRHNERELRSAREIVEFFNTTRPWGMCKWEHRVIDLVPDIFIGDAVQSALLPSGPDVPRAEYAPEGRQPTVVPGRNLNIIAALASIAEAGGYETITLAMHANDAKDYAYPDCTPEFIAAAGEAVEVSTMGQVDLRTPFLNMDKAEIAAYGVDIEVPLGLTYSCYEGRELHCGVCPTCRERQRAFDQAGGDLGDVIDPTEYEVV